MHDEASFPDQMSRSDTAPGGDRKVRAVTFGLGVAALAGLVATTGPAAAGAGQAAADHAQPAVATASILDSIHISCSSPV